MYYPHKISWFSSLLLVSVFLLASFKVHADFQEAVEAYELGNYKRALQNFVPLAQRGNAKALFNIGFMIESGKGVPANPTLAIKWYKRAYKLKHRNAPFNIALIYYNDSKGKQDYVKAMEWYKKAAALGNGAALVNIGQMYFFGKGGKKNKIKAYAWYTVAANRGMRKGIRNRDIVARSLTPFDMNHAEREYRALRAKYLDPFLK